MNALPWWIPALIIGAALLLFYLLRARPSPEKPAAARDDKDDAPPPSPPRPPKRAPRKPASHTNGAGRSPKPRAPAEETVAGPQIASVEVVPGELVVNVYDHTLSSPEGAIPCLSFVSDGLWALGQKELVFTIKRRKDEPKDAVLPGLFELYAAVHRLAAEGRLVDVGGATNLRGAGLLGRPEFLGVLYTPPQVLPEVQIKVPSLTALILTESETAVAQELGVVRLMAILGKRYRYFPTAPWIDRDRPELCSISSMADSILPRSDRVALYAASVRMESQTTSSEEHAAPGGLVDQSVTFGKQRIVLRIRPGAAAILKEALAKLPADAAITFLVGPDPSSPACFAWEPGQKRPFAISRPNVSGDCIAGNFISFVPQQDEDGGIPVEDGFAILLKDETWQRVQAALEGGDPISIAPTGERRLGLEIVRAPELDPDFVDPVEAHVPGGWAVFGGNLSTSEPAFIKSISLLTIVDVIERRVESAPFSEYVKAISAVVESHFGDALPGPGQDLALACEVRPDGAREFGFSVRPGSAELGGLRERLMEIPPPPVALGPIRFQLNVQLWGGMSAKKLSELN